MQTPRHIDFSFYNQHLLGLNALNNSYTRNYLQISELKSANPHLTSNKLSDKMGRRDIQFYDLYKLNEPQTSVQELKQTGNGTEGIYDPTIYEDIEVKDFNSIFRREDLIAQQYGASIKVTIMIKGDSEVIRTTTEDLSKVVLQEISGNEERLQVPQEPQAVDEEDVDIVVLTSQLQNLQNKFKMTKEEIGEVYAQCSGNLNKMRRILDKKEVVTWSYLEDLALACPDDSPEFTVLLSEKGLPEILERRAFLSAEPQYAPD